MGGLLQTTTLYAISFSNPPPTPQNIQSLQKKGENTAAAETKLEQARRVREMAVAEVETATHDQEEFKNRAVKVSTPPPGHTAQNATPVRINKNAYQNHTLPHLLSRRRRSTACRTPT